MTQRAERTDATLLTRGQRIALAARSFLLAFLAAFLPALLLAATAATAAETPSSETPSSEMPSPETTAFEPADWLARAPEQPAAVLVENATVWTSGPDGVIENADLLVRGGKIAAVGSDLEAPAGALVIDGTGKHVTPGLIDAHSHTAIDGDVNEATREITAEVRIQDVINPSDISLYRQLAGGLTAANLLHGSANPIGGQNAVIKLRWGADADGLLMEGAPQGIKFALGENPVRVGGNDRYPNSRQGVEQSIRRAFLAARDYQRRWQAYENGGEARGEVPPRRDLQLDAIVEILEGERLVHAHSYRADEILMLLRLAEEFGVRIASFQHVLEGYKVADELAAHGAGASTFSDWWAYKMEVIEAIPYNGAIMHQRGVVVSFNSDSDELARRMNLEAAKAVRYGGVPEAEALHLVTINPAIQLGIEDRVGSLEAGKDADFVIWSGDPLSTYSLAEQTWVDGRKYFDRADDLTTREAVLAERTQLLAEVTASSETEEEEGEAEGEAEGEEGPDQAEVDEPGYHHFHPHALGIDDEAGAGYDDQGHAGHGHDHPHETIRGGSGRREER